MDWWQTLVGTALLGTDRQSPSIPTDDTPLAIALQQLSWDNPPQALLSTLGAVSLHGQVGHCPQTKSFPHLSPCPVDDRPSCPAVIGRYVQQCQGEYADILPELLALIAQHNQRIPEALLPDLLDLGTRNTALRPAIVAVLGKTGQWLAAQNRAWDYGTGITISRLDVQSEAVQKIWQEGSRGERVALLSVWRDQDANDARVALEQTWTGELAKDRAALLAALGPTISMDDEPFLEQNLDDRAKSVRQAAIALLLQLPESRLCKRMAQRLQPYLQLHHSEQGTVSIEVILPEAYPEAYDVEWGRDGLVELRPTQRPSNQRKSKQSSFNIQGKRAGWLCQLLASTALKTWLLPEDQASQDQASQDQVYQDQASQDQAVNNIMKAIKGHKWQTVLLQGWAIATQRQQNSVWANALLQTFNFETFNSIDPALYGSLQALLSLEQQEALLTQQCPGARNDTFLLWLQQVAYCHSFSQSHDAQSHAVPSHIAQSHVAWSLPFSRFVWQHMADCIQSKQATRSLPYQWFNVIKDVGLTFHVAIAPDVGQFLETLTQSSSGHYWERSLADFYSRLNFRHAIHQVFEQVS